MKATAWRSLLCTSIQISERDGRIPIPQKGKYLHLQKPRRIPRGLIRLSHPIIKANRNYCPDLGCGHGLLARYLPLSFANVLGTDPSSGMVALGSIVNGHSSGTCEKSCVERPLSYPTTALELLLWTRPSTGLNSLNSSPRCILCRFLRNNRILHSGL